LLLRTQIIELSLNSEAPSLDHTVDADVTGAIHSRTHSNVMISMSQLANMRMITTLITRGPPHRQYWQSTTNLGEFQFPTNCPVLLKFDSISAAVLATL
jgi:hypothetical protein